MICVQTQLHKNRMTISHIQISRRIFAFAQKNLWLNPHALVGCVYSFDFISLEAKMRTACVKIDTGIYFLCGDNDEELMWADENRV